MKYNLQGTIKRIFTPDFETFKSNVCHLLHDRGDIEFIRIILKERVINQLVENKLTGYSLYVLAMLDYISKENDIELCTAYDELRKLKLPELVIPVSIQLGMDLFEDDDIFQEAYKKAIPEFLKYNIMEGDIRNVC